MPADMPGCLFGFVGLVKIGWRWNWQLVERFVAGTLGGNCIRYSAAEENIKVMIKKITKNCEEW